MITVQVPLHSYQDEDRIIDWFRESGHLLIGGWVLDHVNFTTSSYAAISESSMSDHHCGGKGWIKIDFTDDLEDVALLFKLTWGGK